MGDHVFVDVRSCEGKAVPGMEAENIPLDLEEPVPGLIELVWGLRLGEEREGELLCPSEYPDPALRGKSVRVRVRVCRLCRRILPEIDEAFAAKKRFFQLEGLEAVHV